MNTKKFSFSQKLRLTSSCEFTYIFKNSHKITIKGITTFIHINNFNFPRIGIVVAKKYIKRASKRNRIKRLVREDFRIHQHSLPNMDFIVTIQKNIIDSQQESIKQTLHKIWRYSYDANLKITNTINIPVPNAH